MNQLNIIGNLTKAPEGRTTTTGKQVCTFTVAVNRTGVNKDKTDFFRVTVWDRLAESCLKYLDKGRKVFVCGTVGIDVYTAQNGETRAQMVVDGDKVEFLSSVER